MNRHWYGNMHGEFIADALEPGSKMAGFFAISPFGPNTLVSGLRPWISNGLIDSVVTDYEMGLVSDVYYTVIGPAIQLPNRNTE